MKKILAFLLVLVMILALAGCDNTPAPTDPTEPTGPMDESGNYHLDEARNEAIIIGTGTAQPAAGNARVYYQIFVGSFSDSNGDGIGDLRGIINRFDYLNDGDPNSGVSLGVEGLWLSPIFISPSYHKYDTSDYYKIDPKFGTEEDLKELIDLCHQRDVQIILDLVINHTATSHQWFKDFVNAHQFGDTENEYYDFYSWTAAKESGKTYQTIPGTDHYYECNFSGEMPELNFDNATVRNRMVEVAKYYLDLGVDGFRFDAAKYIYFGEGAPNTTFWDWYMAELRSIKPDIYTVAEVWDGDGVTFPYFTSTNCFNFSMSQVSGQVAQTAKLGNVNAFTSYLQNYISEIKQRNENAMPITFIANHDMDRAAGFLTVSNGQAFVGANLSILTPGSPFIYYGEEIGMKGSRGGSNTDANRRLAMEWGDGDTVTHPEGANYTSGQTNGSVATHLPNGQSLYNHYKKLIMIRRANPEIAQGTFTALTSPVDGFGGFASTWEGKTVLVLHNTTMETITVDISQMTDVTISQIAAFVGMGNAKLEGTTLTLDGQTSVVLR